MYNGRAKRIRLSKFYREYLVQTQDSDGKQCIQPLFTKKGDSHLCGVGLYSSLWSCSRVATSKVEAELRRLRNLYPTSNRAFGLEFEFVARKYAQSIAGVKRCFSQASRNLPGRNRDKWNWTQDASVKPLTLGEARSLGASSDESRGVGFTISSPDRPNELSGIDGFKSVVDTLTVLKNMGIQAGPTQGMYVHVNLRGDASGRKFSRRQIAYVWAAYAKWQFAINEMLSPSQVPNRFAQSLFLGNCKAITRGDSTKNSCGRTRRIFERLHHWLKKGKLMDSKSDKEFCNYILNMPDDRTPCDRPYPKVRHQQVNLASISKFGTMEFRAHSATYDAERVMRWIQFLIGFVERFGKAGASATGMKEFFSSTAAVDYKTLQRAQQSATLKDLFIQLQRGRPGQARKWRSEDFVTYYGHRKWEKTSDKHCFPTTVAAREVFPTCDGYSSASTAGAMETRE